jgi:hypothetical protein
MPYRLRAGDTGPVQQSPVTCGSACLTVARMHVDPHFAAWVRTGFPNPPGSPQGATPGERFAAYERIVMRRTNSLFPGSGRLNVPWPRQLGTPAVGGPSRARVRGCSPRHALHDRRPARRLPDRPGPGRSTPSSTSSPRVNRGCCTSETPRCPATSCSSFRGTVIACSTSTTPAAAGSVTCGVTSSSAHSWRSAGGTCRGSLCAPTGPRSVTRPGYDVAPDAAPA